MTEDQAWRKGRELLAAAYKHYAAHRTDSPAFERVRTVLEALIRAGESEAPEFQRLAQQAQRVVNTHGKSLPVIGDTFILFPNVRTQTEAIAELQNAFTGQPMTDPEHLAARAVFILQSHPRFFGLPKPEHGAEDRIVERLRKTLRRDTFDEDALCVAALQGWGMKLDRARTVTRSLRR